MSGLTCVANHSRDAFGGLRVKPVAPDETIIKQLKWREEGADGIISCRYSAVAHVQ